MTNYNDGKWHGWNGGECPVHENTVVEAAWSGLSSPVSRDIRAASGFSWDSQVTNIIAFRVIKEHKEPREFWIVGSTTYPRENMAIAALNRAYARGIVNEKIIHVREVIE